MTNTKEQGLWKYHNMSITGQPDKDVIGFVYQIFEKDTNKSYIGIKKFWKTIKMSPLKGMKNKRYKLIESDWRIYNTSSPLMQKKLKKNPKNYDKIIIDFCTSVTEMKCNEAYYQLQYYISNRWNLLYNQIINLRVKIKQ